MTLTETSERDFVKALEKQHRRFLYALFLDGKGKEKRTSEEESWLLTYVETEQPQ